MRRPELVMVRRGALAGAAALPLAAGVGYAVSGPNAAFSSAIGVVVVGGNFAVHGLSLAWAAGVSIPALQAVALGGFVVRMGVIVGLLFALDRTSFFSPVVFGITAFAGTLALLGYEARLVLGGVGRDLEIPPEPAAAAAARRLREAER